MTTITIERELLEQALAALETMTDEYDDSAVGLEIEAIHALRAALSAPATAPEQMPLERDCICHQDLHLDAYSGGAAPEGIYGALWVVVEGVRKKYVLADQSSEPKDMPALATTPKQPRPFVPWSKEAEMLESWAAQPATAPAQPERKPMGQFEIEAAYQESQQHHLRPQDFNKVCDMVRAVEAFHGIKEAP